MLKLGPKREPQKIVLREAVPASPAIRKGGKVVAPATKGEPEAFVVMAPISPAMRRRSQRIALRLAGEVASVSDLDVDTIMDIGEIGSRELIRMGMLEWGGIGDENDKPVDLTPDFETRFGTSTEDDRPTGTIDLLLDDDEIFAKINAEYARPAAQRWSEKNGLSALPVGTGEAATRASGTASSAAARKRTKGAKSARTGSMKSRPKPVKASGRSSRTAGGK